MRKTKVLFSLLMFLLMTTIAWGVSTSTGKWQSPTTALILDTSTTLDANSLEMFVYNDGNFAYDNANVNGKTDGLYFPRGTKKTVIYSAGLWIGGKVNGDTRLAIAEYSSEYVPGPMADGTYQNDSPSFRVYKVNRGNTEDPDYANWPVDQGAPVNDDGSPKILGDQMAWAVFNDADGAEHVNDAAGTSPLGIEVQISAFAYARQGALGQTVFLKYTLINKGSNTIDSTYISLWADPDLGNASDDLVGCDTVLSLGYCYNDGADSDYGSAPPSVGFDFFEGPIVPSAGDSALVNGEYIHDYRNLPMTSFNKYINGTDPASPTETYNYMKGLMPDGSPVVDPEGDTTTYFVPGNPVTGTGWLDEASADRRYMMSSGPFTMAPGDTQEVVAAVLVGQGSNPLSSIDALKLVDRQAQAVFDVNFDIPNPPPSPSQYARGLDGSVQLIWGSEPVGSVDSSAALNQEFHFEGYNVYQGETESGPWHKIGTFDIDDEVGLIYNDVVDPGAGGAQRVIVQKGENSGLTNEMTITSDQITGTALKNNQPYYFAVTAYSYDVRNISEFDDPGGNFLGHLVETLESPINPVIVKPFTFAGNRTIEAAHVGGGDGSVVVEYIDPSKITGDSYRVTFVDSVTDASTDPPETVTLWNLYDVTADSMVLWSQSSQTPGYDFPVVDGFMIRVQGPEKGVKSIAEVATAAGPVDPPDNVNYSYNSTGDYYMDPGGDHSFSRYLWTYPNTHDYEIRFTEGDTEHALGWFNADNGNNATNIGFDVPVEMWDIGSGTPDDPSDDFRVAFMILEAGDDLDGQFSWGDGLYMWSIPYDDIPWNDPNWHTGLVDPDAKEWHYRRFFFYQGGDLDRPAPGTVVRITTNKVNTPDDVYSFETQKPTDATGGDVLVGPSLDNVKVVPNPYYAYYQEEKDQFDRIIKFINMPTSKSDMTIKIYNIAGDLLRTMTRNGGTTNTEFTWDLKTDAGLWVASGIYIWVIESSDANLGTKYGKMAVFPEVEQLDTF